MPDLLQQITCAVVVNPSVMSHAVLKCEAGATSVALLPRTAEELTRRHFHLS